MPLNNTLFPPIVDQNPAPFVWEGDSTSGNLKIEPAFGQILTNIGYRLFDPYGKELRQYADKENDPLEYEDGKVNIDTVLKGITSEYIRNQYYKIQLRTQDNGDCSPWSNSILIRLIDKPMLSSNANLKKI